MQEKEISSLRKHLTKLLRSSEAHIDYDDALKKVPEGLRGSKPPGAAHTPWQLIEHMRIAQWDILEFSRNPSHISPDWPKGYWPENEAPADESAWKESITRFQKDRSEMEKLVSDPSIDLFLPIPHGDGQTILREALLVADHNAYHTGQLAQLCKMMEGASR